MKKLIVIELQISGGVKASSKATCGERVKRFFERVKQLFNKDVCHAEFVSASCQYEILNKLNVIKSLFAKSFSMTYFAKVLALTLAKRLS